MICAVDQFSLELTRRKINKDNQEGSLVSYGMQNCDDDYSVSANVVPLCGVPLNYLLTGKRGDIEGHLLFTNASQSSGSSAP